MAAVVTKYGFVETAKLLTSKSGTAYASMSLGTGSQTENTDVSDLKTAITDSGLSIASAATVNTASSATAGDTAVFAHTWTATGASNVMECGVFNSSDGAKTVAKQILCYGTFTSAIPMESEDTLKVTWSVQVKAG